MAETTAGILDLEIARLERQLAVINQQIAMSEMYSLHQEKLSLIGSELQAQLEKLVKQKERLAEKSSTKKLFKETILLAEDDPEVRHLIGGVLAAQGYTLLEARDGSEALQLATQHKSPIHLLLADIIMPGMNGLVLAQELVQVRSNLKVLFMSGYFDSTSEDHKVMNPTDNLLQKPFNPITLTRKVREVLDG